MQTSIGTRTAKWLPILALCLTGAFLTGCEDVSDKSIVYASLAETRAILMDKPGVGKAIDVRPKADFAKGHLPGALSLELADVPDTKDSIDPALAAYKYLIVYGSDPGSGSAKAMAKRLMTAGHKDVKCFIGGFAEWTGAGQKVEGAAPAR